MRKIGINLHAIKGMSDETYIRTISELGFQAAFTEMMDRERHEKVAELFAVNGISYDTIHAPFGHINDIWLDCEGGEAMYNELVTCIDYCVLTGAPIMVVHLSSGQTPPPVTDLGRKRFSDLVEYAVRKNIHIAFENQRKLANLAWAMECFETDQVGFCWDCGHEACFSPGREYMPLFGNRLSCLHIDDNFGVFNEDKHLIPFDGTINFERVAEYIRRYQFSGTLMLELLADHSELYDGLAPETYLERAASAARRLVTLVDG